MQQDVSKNGSIFFELRASNRRSTHVGSLDFSAREGEVAIPSQVAENLWGSSGIAKDATLIVTYRTLPKGELPLSVQEHVLTGNPAFRYASLHGWQILISRTRGRLGFQNLFSIPAGPVSWLFAGKDGPKICFIMHQRGIHGADRTARSHVAPPPEQHPAAAVLHCCLGHDVNLARSCSTHQSVTVRNNIMRGQWSCCR